MGRRDGFWLLIGGVGLSLVGGGWGAISVLAAGGRGLQGLCDCLWEDSTKEVPMAIGFAELAFAFGV